MVEFVDGFAWGFRIISVCEEAEHNCYVPVRYEVRAGGTTLGRFSSRKDARAYAAEESDRRRAERASMRKKPRR